MPALIDNLATRIAVILLAGLVALQLMIGAVMVLPAGRERGGLFQLPSPAEVLAAAEAMEASPPQVRPLIARAVSSQAMNVRLETDFPLDPRLRTYVPPRRPLVFAPYRRAMGDRDFVIQVRPGAYLQAVAQRDGRLVADGPVRIMVRLRTGEVMTMERTAPAALRRFVRRSAILAALGGLILMAMLWLAIRRTASPVERLAAAARQFSGDLSAPDLPVQGPREIRDLSAAFNEMKRTIRGLVDDRTRMLAAIAHDYRTYLTRLRLRAEFIGDAEQRAKAVEDIDEMGLLLDDTLAFAREATADRAPSAPLDLSEETARFVAARAELGEPVALASAPARLSARVSPLALRRMLANLTDNAVRYGQVARISLRAEDGWAVVRVEDEGPGVPASALERLVKPFERLEESRHRGGGGAGLGLAIVAALAESQGGRLALANRPEGGLCAEVRLALA
ncbi:MAG: ATP-binding protein [Phenylobacterium sp.]|uniref:ATP-binding protein n=1 Tax=Phenylobacterium sp. TaxID=1871053 RepID=UPI00391D7445